MSIYTIRITYDGVPYVPRLLPPKHWRLSVADPQGTIHHGTTWTLSGAHRKAKSVARKLHRQFSLPQYISVYDYDPDAMDDIGWGP